MSCGQAGFKTERFSMADIKSKLNELYSLEQLAGGNSAVHRLHPAAKIIVTIIYIVCVVSLERHSLGRLAPFIIYPAVIMAAADIPYRMIFTRASAALPFCIFAGISNLIIERQPWVQAGVFTITAGEMSFLVLLVRTCLCVGAVLILVAVTPFSELTGQLRRMHVPALFVRLFEMIYRYIGVLVEEASTMLTAYRLRAAGVKWPEIKYFGAFIGQLLLRSVDRAERIYHAMQCRGYAINNAAGTRRRMGAADWLFLLSGAGSAVLFRMVDIPVVLGNIIF